MGRVQSCHCSTAKTLSLFRQVMQLHLASSHIHLFVSNSLLFNYDNINIEYYFLNYIELNLYNIIIIFTLNIINIHKCWDRVSRVSFRVSLTKFCKSFFKECKVSMKCGCRVCI